MTTESLTDLVNPSQTPAGEEHIDHLVIVGGGRMGQGIAVSAARRGIEVLLIEKDDESLQRSLTELAEGLTREIARWAMTESEKKAIMSRIHGAIEFELNSRDLIRVGFHDILHTGNLGCNGWQRIGLPSMG